MFRGAESKRRQRSWALRSPWGVPAFFRSGASRGDVAWNRFGETRLQADATYGGIRQVDVGNLLQANASTIVVLTQVQPINVIFCIVILRCG